VGGIPLDEIGATGFGVRHAIEVAAPFAGVELDGARVVIQGYGNVGRPAAHFLAELGCVVVAAADSRGAVHAEGGLDLAALDALKAEGRSVAELRDAKPVSPEELVAVDCEIWVPAARPDVIHAGNADEVKAKLIASGANIAVTAEAEERLRARGVVNVPDFIANAGGVICAAMEYHGSTQAAVFDEIRERIRSNTLEVLEASRRDDVCASHAAEQLSIDRIHSAMATRRFGVF
jgi:glutamate dehydrogenase (NAD(P)+)